MMLRILRISVIIVGGLMILQSASPLMADNSCGDVEVFIDLDGDGFDDNESDVNKDGISDLVCPVEAPKIVASTADIFSGELQNPAVETKKTNAQRFGLRCFAVRALMINRASATTGFNEIGSNAALGAEACPGGNCGI